MAVSRVKLYARLASARFAAARALPTLRIASAKRHFRPAKTCSVRERIRTPWRFRGRRRAAPDGPWALGVGSGASACASRAYRCRPQNVAPCRPTPCWRYWPAQAPRRFGGGFSRATPPSGFASSPSPTISGAACFSVGRPDRPHDVAPFAGCRDNPALGPRAERIPILVSRLFHRRRHHDGTTRPQEKSRGCGIRTVPAS